MAVIVAFEEHRARRTPAQTTFKFNPPPLVPPVPAGGGLTHRVYVTLVRLGTQATVKRISNRGNPRYIDITVEEEMFIDFLGGVNPLPDRLKRFAQDKIKPQP